MALPRRNLTLHFERAVSSATGLPDTLVVAVVPLDGGNSTQATYVGGVQQQEIVLSQSDNVVKFELLPSDHPTLTQRVVYRVGWRNKYLGRETKYDIIMPDQDMDFNDLNDLGEVLGDGPYIYQSDRLRVGGVAGLDDDGRVIDAFGVPVTGDEAAAQVGARLDEEIINRQIAIDTLSDQLGSELSLQYQSVLDTTASNLALAVSNLHDADVLEASLRNAAVTSLNSALAGLQTSVNNQIAIINNTLSTHSANLLAKADLISGKLAVAQLPDAAIPRAVSVANQAAMLALTTLQVQQGDLAVRPDGVWFLNSSNPAILGSWTLLVPVMSVNGKTGAAVLNASDVGARSSSAPVPLADVSGLMAALAGKADASLADRVTAIEDDDSIVRKEIDGFVDSSQFDDGIVYLDNADQLVKKDGTVLVVDGGGVISSVNGQTGVVVLDAGDVGARGATDPIAQSDITGLATTLSGKVDTSDARLSDARTPTAHAASHQAAGSDPLLPIGQSDVTGLVAALAGKASASTVTNYGVRISSLETRVTDLEAGGGGGGGGGSSAKTVWYDAPGPVIDITSPSEFQDEAVLLKSPWGKDSSGKYYYDPAGAAEAEQLWPYITPNGHLELREWNEANPADPALATQSALNALTTTVGTKADQSSLTATNVTVAGKANQTDLDATNAVVGTKASQSDLNATNATVAQKANQTDLAITNTNVSLKANQSDLDTTNTTVAAHTATLATKADLVSGTVPLAQLPNNIPQNKISGLEAALLTKADLVAGVVPTSQIPTNIPQASIAGLATTLSGKADLIGGVIPTNQLPSLATSEVEVVANRAAMLSLSPAQVQKGDLCVITSTSDQGTYILSANDPSQFSNWVKLSTPAGAVSSVNGQTGVVVLGAGDVGARSASAAIPQSDVTGLTTALNSKADQSTTTAALATKTTQTDVQTIVGNSSLVKLQVQRASTAHIATLSGLQSVDGSPVTVGMRVLVKNQSSSIQNGIYLVTSVTPTPLPWTRVSDMASGSYCAAGSLVYVSGGNTQANTIWQQTASSGLVDVAANQWSKIGDSAPPYSPVQGNGILISGTTFSVKPSTGISVTSSGVGIDSAVIPSKFTAAIPTSNPVTINHNLGTEDIQVTIHDKLNDVIVEAGVSVTSPNQIVIEFANTPISGQYRVVVIG